MVYTLTSDSPFWKDGISPKYQGLLHQSLFYLIKRTISKNGIYDHFFWKYFKQPSSDPISIGTENITSFTFLLSFLADTQLSLVHVEEHKIPDIIDWLTDHDIDNFRFISTSAYSHFVELDTDAAVLLKLSLD